MANIIAEVVRMCSRHKEYVKECPRCQVMGKVEEHNDSARKVKPTVCVYKKTWKSNNKYSPVAVCTKI